MSDGNKDDDALDTLDKLIMRLSARKARIVPASDIDIDLSDCKMSDDAAAALQKRRGFPVEGVAGRTENEKQAAQRRRVRIRKMKELAKQEESDN